ncbi:unnamed protein product [Caenorhabditis sp. 36 PRJEB53466]|nr:unnamed protein product [Caenorhabditis sp. 36 PRJEB53466]
MPKFLLVFIATSVALVHGQHESTADDFLWNRWEPRTIDCVSSGKKDDCVLLAPESRIPFDITKFKCRREPMPQQPWNTLAVNSTTRLACPLNCPVHFDLSVSWALDLGLEVYGNSRLYLSNQVPKAGSRSHNNNQVLQKRPYVNKNCQKYYTYGKYWDAAANDWYIWQTEPCVAAISTHCRFNDVPILQSPLKTSKGKNAEEAKIGGASQTKASEQRRLWPFEEALFSFFLL